MTRTPSEDKNAVPSGREPTELVYRVYWINKAGRVDAAARIMEAESDAEAERQAGAMADGHPVELWRSNRLLRKINPPAGE